jgi:hypothetical protein
VGGGLQPAEAAADHDHPVRAALHHIYLSGGGAQGERPKRLPGVVERRAEPRRFYRLRRE